MLRVPVANLVAPEMLLDRATSHYVAHVRRLRVGERVTLFDPARATWAPSEILAIDSAGVRCQVGAISQAACVAQRRVSLLQGLPKADKADAIVRDATELGATSIVLVEMRHSVTRLVGHAKASERLTRWQRIAREAARQCGRGDAPEVAGPLLLARALCDANPEGALKLCLWEKAETPIAMYLSDLPPERPVVLLVGPEGGIDSTEVEEAAAAGFQPVSLGPFILRTETVAAAVLGALLLRL